MKTWADFGIEVHGSGPEVYTTCPQCSDTRKKKLAKCLSANLDEGVWICHHCGWSGTLKDGGRRGEIQHWQRPAYRKPESRPADVPPHEKMVAWFASRGITQAVLERNRIASGVIYMPQTEGEERVIVFPYFRKGDVVNRKYRDGAKHFRLDAGAEPIWYGLDDAEEVTYVVEGECDKLSLEVAGARNCISVPHGAPAVGTKDYSSKFDFLENCKADTAHVKTWILAVDNDEPGRLLEDELTRRLGREKCMRVRWTAGCKDANDVLQQHGADELARCLAAAEPFPVHGVFTVLDMSDRVRLLYDRGLERGFETGWTNLDGLYTVRPGEMTVVTGIPNSGKSNWLDALTVNLCAAHGWRIAVCSPENYPTEEHVARYVEKWAGQPFDRGPTERMSEDTLNLGLRWANEHYRFILPQEDMTLAAVIDSATQLVYRDGIKGLVLDPWNEFEHKVPTGKSETQYICDTLTMLRHWARKSGVHLWIVVHPAKLFRDKEGGYPVPTLYDCAGSAHWRNKADNGVSIWRDFGNDNAEVEIHVQKVRFRNIGKIGMAKLKYNRVTGQYSNSYGPEMRGTTHAAHAAGVDL